MRKPKPPVVDHEVMARKVAAMTLGRATARAERLAAQAKLLAEYTAMDLEELRRHSNTKMWLAAIGEASGATNPEIASLTRHRGGAVSVHRLRKHPVVRRMVELIQQHQLQLVLRGEFGAVNAAKAAAPAIVQNLCELGGAAPPDAEGKRAGRAKRDADSIRAGEAILNVAGLQRQQHHHIHEVLFSQLDDSELEHLANTGQWPSRLEGAVAGAGNFTAPRALPGPGVNGGASRANGTPTRGGRGR
jgi:hypothetical protein